MNHLELTDQELDVIMRQLTQGPWMIVNPVIVKIMEQANKKKEEKPNESGLA